MSNETKNGNDTGEHSEAGSTRDGDEQPPAGPSRRPSVKSDEHLPKMAQLTDRLTALSLERIGALVFLISAIGIIVVIWQSLFDKNIENYEALRSAEILLILAATSLVVALIAKTKYTAIMVLGFLFIGALIVPINDLIRLTLIATGSNQKFQDFFVESSTGKSQISRNFEIASRIYARLETDGLLDNSLQNRTRQDAIAGISGVLDEAKRVEAIEKVQQRGVYRLLEAMNNSETKNEWIYRFADDEKFRGDLHFLRSEGLVSYVYDDYDTIVTQDLGRQVLRGPQFSSPSRHPYPLVAFSARNADLPPFSPPEVTEIAEIQLVPDYRAFDERQVAITHIGFEYSWFSFTVTERGSYVIDVLAQNTEVDPLLSLLGSTNPDDLLREDDDSGENYNPRIVEQLDPGKYYIAVRNLNVSDGNVRIVIGKLSGTAALQMQ